MRGSAEPEESSRPQLHEVVPAANTMALLGDT
jgi:hypothetical protein